MNGNVADSEPVVEVETNGMYIWLGFDLLNCSFGPLGARFTLGLAYICLITGGFFALEEPL